MAFFDRDTGARITKSRIEVIDTIESDMFTGANTALKVHDRYEDFWNHLSDHPPNEVVFVESIARMY